MSIAKQYQLKEPILSTVQTRIEQIAVQNPPNLDELELNSDQSVQKKKKKRKTKKSVPIPVVAVSEEPKVQSNEKKAKKDGFKVVTKGAVMSARTGGLNTTMSMLAMQLGESSSEDELEEQLRAAIVTDEDVSEWME